MSDYNPIVPIDTSPRNGSVNVGTNGQGGVTVDVASAKPVSVTISSKETSIGASVRRDGMVDIDIANAYRCSMIFSDTVAGWASKPKTIGKQGAIYIYTDYKTNDDNQPIPGFKVGDGNAYLIDIPFSDQLTMEHINNTIIHITNEERTNWNEKMRCYVDGEKLVFTNH